MRDKHEDRRVFLKRAGGALTALSALGSCAASAQQTPAPAAPVPAPKKARVTSSVMLWTLKGSFEEKVAAAAAAGLQSLELVSEQHEWTDAEAAKNRRLVESYGMGMDALLSQTDWTKRPVSMVNPEHREGFLSDVREAIVWAKKLNVPQIIVLSGNEQPGLSHEQQYASMVEGGKRATSLGEAADVKLILENLNSKVNHKGYFLTSAREATKAAREVDSAHFRLLFDIYHEYVQNGDPIPAMNEAEPYVAVYHVADAPGRHDPGTGQMKWDDIYKSIGKSGYSGFVTLEYLPAGDQVPSLIKAVTQMRKDLNASMPPAISEQNG
jgi:hydroxypyruvate isomerase